MDYLGMLGFSCIFLGCVMLIGLAVWLIRDWWTEREKRRSLQVIKQMEDEHYAGLRESLLSHVDGLIRKVDRQ